MTPQRKTIAALTLAGAAILLTTAQSVACAICMVAMNVAPGQKLGNADIAVLAWPSPAGGWQVLTRLKPANGDPVDLHSQNGIGESVDISGDIANNQANLLVRDSLGYRWTSLGTFDLNYAGWLTSLAALPEPTTVDEWLTRLELVAPQLECGDPGVEDLAHGELARAPYPAFRMLRGVFSTAELRKRIDNETNQSRRASYLLLLGHSGEEEVVTWLKEHTGSALKNDDSTDLAALLAAELELLGPSHLEWIAGNILLKPGTPPAMIEAALLALAVHGDEDQSIPRSDIVEIHKRFIQAKPPMADYVATKLMDWNDWSLIGDYTGLLESGAITNPATEFAATLYIETGRDALTGKATQK
ncbi:hypothetical protein [Roseibium sp. M-1]